MRCEIHHSWYVKILSKIIQLCMEELPMNYKEVGERIRKIRETELNMTREKFAEEIGISLNTLVRLENASGNVTNIEFFIRIAEITGYTLDELTQEGKQKDMKSREKMITRINYLLNVVSPEELEYISANARQFIQFCHQNEIKTLKEIKDDIKK